MKIEIVATTDIGNHREQNEDAFSFCPDLGRQDWTQSEALVDYGEFGSILLVADGMGGANAGEVASACAMETIQKQYIPERVSSVVQSGKPVDELLTEAIGLADEAINDLMAKRPETYGMGTTIVACWLLGDKAHIAWCGDSRCYVYNQRKGLKALTKDHSLVQEMVDRGEITEKDAFRHPDNNVITRGLGDFDAKAVPDTVTYDIQPNDIFLLCSDGLCGYCDHRTLESIVKANRRDLKRCCDRLLQAALNAGAEDNITLALATVVRNRRRLFCGLPLFRN